MFGLFTSEQKRARHDAQNWLHLADKIFHFRRDLLPAQETQAIQQARHELRTRLKDGADAAKLKMGMERLEGCLRKSGGAYYPKSSMVDNVEFFLVALILFLGIRAFIIQPFKIPTNSMWPTYNGMTAEAYVHADKVRDANQHDELGTVQLRPASDEPGPAARALRWLAFGASPRRLTAPVDGEVFIPWIEPYLRFPGEQVPERRWLVIPSEARRYTLYVGSTPVTVTVPSDFRYDYLIRKTFFNEPKAMERAVLDAQIHRRKVEIPAFDGRQNTRSSGLLLATGLRVRAGERLLSFDVLTGDQLFVDRVSYHFVKPKVGDGFVFRTNHIRNIEPGHEFTDKYYIKRLVGVPGDKLEVHPPVLFRNGEPIEGAAAFGKNARQEDGYPGYTEAPSDRSVFLKPGGSVNITPRNFFAMGDNSPDSADGRFWGFVPADDVIGRPFWVYFPFTRRWGLAR